MRDKRNKGTAECRRRMKVDGRQKAIKKKMEISWKSRPGVKVKRN